MKKLHEVGAGDGRLRASLSLDAETLERLARLQSAVAKRDKRPTNISAVIREALRVFEQTLVVTHN